MDFLIEIVFRIFIVRTVGLYSRFFFFKFIGREKKVEYLTGEKGSDGGISQDFYNAVIGVFVVVGLFVSVAYLVYS